ncbi:MAG TPA: PaaI family thioesterase, partial [Dehalococcoidia bacterium]
PHGVLHGGVLFSAMDTAMGGALTSVLEAGERCATMEAKVNYLAPVVSDSLSVEAHVLHRGRRTAVLESRATAADGRLAALALGTFTVGRGGNQGSRA